MSLAIHRRRDREGEAETNADRIGERDITWTNAASALSQQRFRVVAVATLARAWAKWRLTHALASVATRTFGCDRALGPSPSGHLPRRGSLLADLHNTLGRFVKLDRSDEGVGPFGVDSQRSWGEHPQGVGDIEHAQNVQEDRAFAM